MPLIDPSSRVEDGADIADDVIIGPFCHVGPNVSLGAGVRLVSHAVIAGHTKIGAGTQVFPFASLGQPPQSVHYHGGPTRLEIGANCLIRENVTVNTGTEGGGGLTRIGDNCFLMACSHVAHDCFVGDNVIFANNATLAGHVTVGNNVFLGGICAVHQFVRIGEQVIIGGMTGVERDVIPFASVIGDRGSLGGLNLIGLKRRGFSRAQIHALRGAYRMLFFSEGSLAERVERVATAYAGDENVAKIVDFVRIDTKRRLTTPRDKED